MKKFKLLLASVAVTGSFSQASMACTKEDAKKAVLEACTEIEKDSKEAKDIIRKKRHCGTNYVWLQDSDTKMVLHPIKPRLNGKDLTKNKDEDGKLLFVEFDKMAKGKAEGGWVDYLWAKPGAEKATAKTSFVKLCDPKGVKWIAGSGIWKK